jgi:hypothetical protein
MASAAPTARLVYSRGQDAASCPDEQSLRKAVAARVGYDPFFAWAQRTIVANVARREAAFVASVDLIDEQGIAHGARELRSAGACDELLDAVALAIAIAIDPQSLVSPAAAPAPSASISAPPPSPPAPVPAPEPLKPDAVVLPSPPPPPSWRLEASAGAIASREFAPSVSLGVALGGAIRWPSLSVGVEARADAPASATAPGGGQVASWLVLGALVPCVYLGPVLGCALVQGGAMHAYSLEVSNALSRDVAWWAAGVRLGALIPIGGDFFLRPRAEILANLNRKTLEVNGQDAWEPEPVAESAGIDAVARFR